MGNGLLYFLLTLGMISWGESWISAKVLTRFAEPDVLVFWRFFVTWITFIPVMYFMKKPFKISKKGLISAVAGAILLVLYNEMFFTGLVYGLAGAGGILVTTLVPIMTFALGCLFTLKAPSGKDTIGLILGAVGAGIIMKVWNTDLHLLLKSGNAYFLTAAVSWAVLTHNSKRANRYASAFTYSFYLFMFTSIFVLVPIYMKGMTVTMPSDVMFISNILMIAVGATTYGTTIYFVANNTLGSQKASSFIFLVPVIALTMSYMFLGEPIQLNTVVGGISAITAVYLINHTKRIKLAK